LSTFERSTIVSTDHIILSAPVKIVDSSITVNDASRFGAVNSPSGGGSGEGELLNTDIVVNYKQSYSSLRGNFYYICLGGFSVNNCNIIINDSSGVNKIPVCVSNPTTHIVGIQASKGKFIGNAVSVNINIPRSCNDITFPECGDCDPGPHTCYIYYDPIFYVEMSNKDRTKLLECDYYVRYCPYG
jgi:hypothetical protein